MHGSSLRANHNFAPRRRITTKLNKEYRDARGNIVMTKRVGIEILLATLIVSAAAQARADDWPRWMGPNGDGVWAETGIIDRFDDAGAKILWRHKVGGGYGGPSVSSGRVFVMDRTGDAKGGTVENNIGQAGKLVGAERVQCIDANTGRLVWEHSYECEYTIAYPTGPRCTPTVDGDHVYTLGAMGDLICFRAATGNVVWKKQLARQYKAKPPLWGYSSHPLVDGKQLLVPAGGKGSGVVAFDKLTGAEIWKSVTTRDIAYAPMVLHEPKNDPRQLLFWHAEGVTSLDPKNGAEYWNVKFPEQVNPSQTSIATPRIVGDKLLISEFYKGSMLLQIQSSPPGVKEIWRSYENDKRHKSSLNSMMTTPVVKDGLVYGISYVGRGIGTLRCFELDSGKMKWNKDDWMEKKPVVFATSFIVENHGRYFMFNDNGEMMIAKLSADGFEEISRAKVLEPTSVARGRSVVWSHPAFANKRAYLRNDKEIICVDLAKP